MVLLRADGERVETRHIAVGFLSHRTCVPEFAIALAEAMMYTAMRAPRGIRITPRMQSETKIADGRNRLAAWAIELGASHLVMIDDDMGFPADAILRLLAHDVDIVGVNYPTRYQLHIPTAKKDGRRVYTDDSSTGIEPVDSLGAGLLMMTTAALKAMRLPDRPWFAQIPRCMMDDPKPFDWRSSAEDSWFCQIARKVGIAIHLDHDLSKQTTHFGLMGVTVETSCAMRAAGHHDGMARTAGE